MTEANCSTDQVHNQTTSWGAENMPFYITCRNPKSLWHREKRITEEHPTETRVPWQCRQVRICHVYKNEGISQLKKSLEDIWLGTELNAVLDFSFYGLVLWLQCFHSRSMNTKYTENTPAKCQLFNSARKTKNVLVGKLIFADDSAIAAHNNKDAQKMITCCSKSTKLFRLKINLNKTKIMHQHLLGFHETGKYIKIEN